MKYETKNSRIVIGCISFFYKNNRIIYILVILKETDADHCIVVTSMFQPKHKSIFEKEAKKAIISAQILN